MTRKNALTFRLLSYLLEETTFRKRRHSGGTSAMTSIHFFYNREFPGNALRANVRQALEHLGMEPEVQETETVPEQAVSPLPALAIDGKIVVSGVEPSVHELELLFQDLAQEREEDSPCDMNYGGINCTEDCPLCRENGTSSGIAGKIIGFAILLIILFTAVKILS